MRQTYVIGFQGRLRDLAVVLFCSLAPATAGYGLGSPHPGPLYPNPCLLKIGVETLVTEAQVTPAPPSLVI